MSVDGKIYCGNLIVPANKNMCLTYVSFWRSEKWYGEDDPIEEDGIPDATVAPALSSRRINNSAVRTSTPAASARVEPGEVAKSKPHQPLRRLSTGTNRFGLVQEDPIDSDKSDLVEE